MKIIAKIKKKMFYSFEITSSPKIWPILTKYLDKGSFNFFSWKATHPYPTGDKYPFYSLKILFRTAGLISTKLCKASSDEKKYKFVQLYRARSFSKGEIMNLNEKWIE